MDSILDSIKKALGISEGDNSFDVEIIMHINSIFMILNDLGVGPEDGFYIVDSSEVWEDFLGERKSLEAVKTYVYQKVKLVFDPPTGALLEALKESVKEFEWRLRNRAEEEVW